MASDKDRLLKAFLSQSRKRRTKTTYPGLGVKLPQGGKTSYRPEKSSATLANYRPAKRNIKRLPRV